MSIKGKLIFVLFSIILSIIFINTKNYFVLALLVLFLIYCFKKFDLKFSLILLLIFLIFSVYRPNKVDQSLNNQNVTEEYKIKEVNKSYIIVENDKKYIVYLNDTSPYLKGNIVSINGTYMLLTKDLDIDVFDFYEYLYNKRIHYQIIVYDIHIIDGDVNISDKIISFLTNKLKNESLAMCKMLLFNDKSIDTEAYENLKQVNALHLFVVSGFHISFIISLINKLLKNKKVGTIVSFIICLFYVFLLDFSISALRAFLTTYLYILFKDYINKLDCLAISGIFILLMEPLNIFNYSFIMSFLMSFTIILISKSLSKYSKLLQAIIISFVAFIVMIPIQLQLNYQLNFISLISNIILSYVVMVIFVLCIISMIVSFISPNVFGFVYSYFNQVIEKLSSYDTTIVFGAMNKYMIVIYYVLVLLFLYFLEKGKTKNMLISSLLIFFLMVSLYNRGYFLFYQKVTFLNVYQGDCCIIQDSFTNKVMLIDTGGLVNYDIASKKILPYLKHQGIRKIDVIVITHDDYDHNGALESLCDLIQVDNIITDCNVKNVELGKLSFSNLNSYSDEFIDKNDKSIVLYGNICGLDFLFAADISQCVETKIINDNPYINVDVLKVSHHGSKTSTSKTFVEAIDPRYAIISVGKNNYYGHPSQQVIDILTSNATLIYRTDEDGTIRFIGKIFDFYFIEKAK